MVVIFFEIGPYYWSDFDFVDLLFGPKANIKQATSVLPILKVMITLGADAWDCA